MNDLEPIPLEPVATTDVHTVSSRARQPSATIATRSDPAGVARMRRHGRPLLQSRACNDAARAKCDM
jgi:hypothetical protein